MKDIVRILLLFVLILSPFSTPADTDPTVPTPQIITETVKRATIALYEGKQVCKWTSDPGFFGPSDTWGCSFKSAFACTATVFASQDGDYLAITAGHCFDWNEVRQGNYYVADLIDDKPVLHHVAVHKFENDDRYDFGIVAFHSYRDYPAIQLNRKDDGAPAIGTEVLNVNFALGITKQIQTGKVVSGLIGPGESVYVKGARRRYLLNLAAGPGASGSALVDLSTGRIVGLVEAYFPGTQMPMLAIPTGERLFSFFDDDSAGLMPKPVGPKPELKQELMKLMTSVNGVNVARNFFVGAAVYVGIMTLILFIFRRRTS